MTPSFDVEKEPIIVIAQFWVFVCIHSISSKVKLPNGYQMLSQHGTIKTGMSQSFMRHQCPHSQHVFPSWTDHGSLVSFFWMAEGHGLCLKMQDLSVIFSMLVLIYYSKWLWNFSVVELYHFSACFDSHLRSVYWLVSCSLSVIYLLVFSDLIGSVCYKHFISLGFGCLFSVVWFLCDIIKDK